jgi:hypothetical protein
MAGVIRLPPRVAPTFAEFIPILQCTVPKKNATATGTHPRLGY